MKKIAIVFMMMMVASSTTSFASHHGGECKWSAEKQEKYVEKKMDKMTKAFDLSDSQQKEVEVILRDKMDKKKAAKERYKKDKEQISADFKTKMNTILTDEQKPAFDKMVAKYDAKKHKKKKRFLFF